MDLKISVNTSDYTIQSAYKCYQNLCAILAMQAQYNAKNLEKIEGNTISEKQFTYFKLIADTYYLYRELDYMLVKQGFANDSTEIRSLTIHTPDWFLVKDYNDPENDYPWGRYTFEAIAPQSIANLLDKKVLSVEQVQALIKQRKIIVKEIYIGSDTINRASNEGPAKHEKDMPRPAVPCLDFYNLGKVGYLFYNSLYPNLFPQFLEKLEINTLEKDIENTAKGIRVFGAKQLEKDEKSLKRQMSQIKDTKAALKEVNKGNGKE